MIDETKIGKAKKQEKHRAPFSIDMTIDLLFLLVFFVCGSLLYWTYTYKKSHGVAATPRHSLTMP
ncbi:hypothetical protein [Methylobacterium sp. B1]|uniref:hypothetical protein n=1 Tax=Methylobacterium sp. B1 TaxID=91459 RepID=UPI0011D27D48|nr:hypothetical protein [Methylobacterium sp. B1]